MKIPLYNKEIPLYDKEIPLYNNEYIYKISIYLDKYQ